MDTPKPQFRLQQFCFLVCILGMMFAFLWVRREQDRLQHHVREIDVKLDRWIDARNLSDADRLQAIEELLKTRKSAAWFWRERDHKFDYIDAED